MKNDEHNILSTILYPDDLRRLPLESLPQVCDELRQLLIKEVSGNPGHFASSLGVVELTVALHYVFDTPEDRIVWDVGHQAYVHKILTGRREAFHTNRHLGGIKPFPSPEESVYDTATCGHASVSISVALGMAVAAQREGKERTHQQPETGKKPGKKDTEKIRVLLTNDAMNSIYHDTIRISGTEELVVSQNGSNRHFAKGKTVTYAVTGRNRLKDPIEISCPKGRIKVTSITRSGKNPVYRGSMKLVKKKQGILLVNTLTLREYLYGVVPSEMPSSYPMEALRAQAVCARSFAWRQIRSNSYKVYGADVDDTTNFQVYHMSGEDARTRKAVRSTAGQMVYSGDKVIKETEYMESGTGVESQIIGSEYISSVPYSR